MSTFKLPKDIWDLSHRGIGRVLLITAIGTLGTLAIALLTVSFTTQHMDIRARELSYLAAFVLPVVISGPVYYVFASKIRQLAVAHHDLAIIASQDSLTTVLNRGAFITLVDAYLNEVRNQRHCTGGLLVMDADHFKQVNDRYGHANGDAALKLIAASISRGLRNTDLVGRVGGEEFAVFLPGADGRETTTVAERIRTQVREIDFRPAGVHQPLTISIGGATFISPITFAELFSAADARLYAAKAAGRDRVDVGPAVSSAAYEPSRRLVVNG